eukprot:TRINITY_DN13486_c0_g1_i15.p2 TRINITY_DN13486_c0_g1~~TRINITY_DN13486_c0_g1_i15.p2  ORF type:complete len:126 (-),score=27.93 TRINITY_DN13486_c0_g1_i15:161-538(-)
MGEVVSMAWEKWQQVYADLKFANRMGGGAIRRMLNRKLSMAFEKWQFTAGELARQQFMLGGAVKRMMARQVSMAWEKWQQVYADLNVDGMGEVAAGVVCEQDGRWRDPAYAEQVMLTTCNGSFSY